MNEDRRSMLVGLLLAPVGALVGRLWGKRDDERKNGFAEFAKAIRDGTAKRNPQCDAQGGFLVPEEVAKEIEAERLMWRRMDAHARLLGPGDCGYEPEAFSAARLRREPEMLSRERMDGHPIWVCENGGEWVHVQSYRDGVLVNGVLVNGVYQECEELT